MTFSTNRAARGKEQRFLQRHCPCRRKGYVVILVAMVLIVLLGMIGIVVDSGVLIGSYRQTQNAADAAALAAALDLSRGQSISEAQQDAEAFVRSYNGLQNAEVAVSIPPTAGEYATDSNTGSQFVQVAVSQDVGAFLIHVLPGVDVTNEVSARAVAGYEPLGEGEGVIILDPLARPGLTVDGNGLLWVDGSIVVNAMGSGFDQYNRWLDTGYQQYACEASNNTTVHCRYLQVVGGVNTVANFKHIEPDGPSPLFAGAAIVPDPLADLPIPDTTNGVVLTMYGRRHITNSDPKPTFLEPGIYEDIFLSNGAEVVFNPGIYVLVPKSPNQGLRINGGATVTGNGVMFYATGSNYLSNGVGYWDRLDGPVSYDPPTYVPPPPPDPNFSGVRFATVDINLNSGNVNFTGLDDPNSPFHGIWLFARRRANNVIQFQGNADDENVFISGIVYAKTPHFKLAGGARFNSQFIVATMQVTGQAYIFTDSARNFGLTKQVFLVE